MEANTVKITNAQLVAACLKRHGVEYIFGQSNPSRITLACMDAGIRQIAYRQENTGSYMAQAYSMATGKVPVVTAQNGPAATLLVPGMAECMQAAHPMVCIVQQVAVKDFDRNAFQELDHIKLFEGNAKWIKTIYSADRIEDYIDMAFTQAASGRPGPVVLLFPVDIFNDTTPYERDLYRAENLGYCPLDRAVADPSKIAQAAALLAKAEHPLIYAGGGLIKSRAQKAVRALQETYGFPVATTIMGKGSVDETHPLSIGVAAYITDKRGMARYAKPFFSEADVILLVGNRTNQNGTDSWTLLPKNATYIHIDIDNLEVGRNYESLRLVGDAKLTLEALHKELGQHTCKVTAKRAENEARLRQARELHLEEIRDVTVDANQAPIRPEKLMSVLEGLLEDDHILVCDASFSSIWMANYLSSKKNREFYFPRGLAGLGWGLPMAMGAKLAYPDRKVFCLCGDGGFAHAWSELECCQREGIDVVCVVLNNEILAYQYYAEKAKYGRYTNACEMNSVDYAKIAEACGLKGLRLSDPDQIEETLKLALSHQGTVLIDMITEPNAIPPVTVLLGAEMQV